jgi:hypothetical protein
LPRRRARAAIVRVGGESARQAELAVRRGARRRCDAGLATPVSLARSLARTWLPRCRPLGTSDRPTVGAVTRGSAGAPNALARGSSSMAAARAHARRAGVSESAAAGGRRQYMRTYRAVRAPEQVSRCAFAAAAMHYGTSWSVSPRAPPSPQRTAAWPLVDRRRRSGATQIIATRHFYRRRRPMPTYCRRPAMIDVSAVGRPSAVSSTPAVTGAESLRPHRRTAGLYISWWGHGALLPSHSSSSSLPPKSVGDGRRRRRRCKQLENWNAFFSSSSWSAAEESF